MMIAVLQRRASVAIGKQDVYAATVGGVRLTEPSVDLAIALALASASSNLSVPGSLAAIGEVGLAGEIRRVAGLPRRLAEAERMGFRRAIVPPGSLEPLRQAGSAGSLAGIGTRMDVREAADVAHAIALGLGG
jgi:DNA repair protein RadA/Sms